MMSGLLRNALIRRPSHLSTAQYSTTPTPNPASKLFTKYNFKPPLSFKPQPEPPLDPPLQPAPPPAPAFTPHATPKPRYRPPSSLDRTGLKPIRATLPFDFRFSYTESSPDVRPIGLREPKYSPFGPDRVDRVWTGVCAPVVDPKEGNVEIHKELEEKRMKMFEEIQGQPLTKAEIDALVRSCHKDVTKKQINLGRDGLTHNTLNDVHNNWKRSEAVRIKCMGVPTVDMKNICYQLEDKSFGKIISRCRGMLVLYRGRNYILHNRPVIPLMLWKPHEPVYPKLIKTPIDGLTIKETKEMRRNGLALPALTKLGKNGYYGSLVLMVRDAFLSDELVRIDCKGLPPSDYKKIGCKLRDLVPCILVTFDKEQIVVWRGKDYKPIQGYFLTDRETFDNLDNDIFSCTDEDEVEDTRS